MRIDHEAPERVMEALFVQSDDMGQATGISLVLARDGAALWLREVAGGAVVESAWIVPVTSTARRSTTSAGCASTKRSSSRCGSRGISPIPAALRLPLILADVSALIAGGYRRIFFK